MIQLSDKLDQQKPGRSEGHTGSVCTLALNAKSSARSTLLIILCPQAFPSCKQYQKGSSEEINYLDLLI